MNEINSDKGSPYRIQAEIEKETKPTWFEILKEWFKNLDSDSIFLL